MSDLPPGNQFVEPPPEYAGNLKTMNWGGFYVKVGLGYSPFFFNELERIRKNIEACIIAVTGKGGSGKTYFALRMAQIMDPKFNPEVQVPFGSEELMTLIGDNSPLKMGQVIIIDESQFGMSSRDWFNDMQKDIMKQIEAIRSRGFIIFIVALNTKTLDVIARNYVMTHLIHMLHRGEGTVYKFYMPAFAQEPYKTKLGKVRLNIPGYEECKHPTCLRCPSSGLKPNKWKQKKKWIENGEAICYNLRAIYERKKKSYLEAEAQKVDSKNLKKAIKNQGFPEQTCLENLALNAVKLKKTRNGKVNQVSIRMQLEAEFPDIHLTDNQCRTLSEKFELIYPTEFALISR